jgi:hypothetical protein
MKMIGNVKISILIRAAGLVAFLVIAQEMVAHSIFGLSFEWSRIPLLVVVNFAIVAGWYYIKKNGIKIPMFVVLIASFFLTIWLRAVMIYIGLFRVIAPAVTTFFERQIAILVTIFGTPQVVPALIAATILLLLLPKAKNVYKEFRSNGFLMPPNGL